MFQFFKERVAVSNNIFKKKCATASERKCAAASLNYVPLRNILK